MAGALTSRCRAHGDQVWLDADMDMDTASDSSEQSSDDDSVGFVDSLGVGVDTPANVSPSCPRRRLGEPRSQQLIRSGFT
jgi:hypothetical protein